MDGEGQGQAFSSKFHCSIKTTIKLKSSTQIPGFGNQRDLGSSPHWLTFTFKAADTDTALQHCIPTIHEAFTRLTALPIWMQNHSDDELSYKLIPSSAPPPTWNSGPHLFSSVQDIYALKKSIWALPHLWEVSPTLPLKRFQCSSGWWRPIYFTPSLSQKWHWTVQGFNSDSRFDLCGAWCPWCSAQRTAERIILPSAFLEPCRQGNRENNGGHKMRSTAGAGSGWSLP